MFSIKKNKDSPDKTRYLKTLGDQILSKTQLALIAVNNYEMRMGRVAVPKTSFVLQNEISEQNCKTIHFTLREDVEQKVSMLGESVDYYKINCKGKIFPLKIYFTHVKNSFRFLASFKNMFPSEETADYDFIVNKAIRRTFNPEKQKNVETLFICLQAKNSIGMMSMRISFYNQLLESLRTEQSSKSIRVRKKEYSPLRTYSFLTKNNFNFEFDRKSREDKLFHQLRANSQQSPMRTHTSSTNFKRKNMMEATHFNQLNQSRRVLTSEKKEKRLRQTRSRREDFWQHKQKERELRERAASQKKIINLQQRKLNQNQYQKRVLTRDITTFIYLHKFIKHINARKDKLCEQIRSTARVSMYQNKFRRVLKEKHKSFCSVLPMKKHRDQATAFCALYLDYRINTQSSHMRTGRLMCNFFNVLSAPMRVNDAMNRASEFRRKLRLVQKTWKAKYNARLKLIEMSGQNHVNDLLDKYPKFEQQMPQFKSGGYLRKICLEYIKQTAVKFNQMYMAYHKRMEELWEQKRLNEMIRQMNLKLPPKQQRPMMDLSKQPVQPHYRFFRDLDILRGNLRGWFEMEKRKKDKKNRRWD